MYFTIIFMLPKLDKLAQLPYSSYTQELVGKKSLDSNIHRLKLLKEFLDDDQFCQLSGCDEARQATIANCRSKVPRSVSHRKSLKVKTSNEKEPVSLLPSARRQLADEVTHLVSQHSLK